MGQERDDLGISGIYGCGFRKQSLGLEKITICNRQSGQVKIGGSEMVVEANRFLQCLKVLYPAAKPTANYTQVVVGLRIPRINSDRFIQPFDSLLPISLGDELVGFVQLFSGIRWNIKIDRRYQWAARNVLALVCGVSNSYFEILAATGIEVESSTVRRFDSGAGNGYVITARGDVDEVDFTISVS